MKTKTRLHRNLLGLLLAAALSAISAAAAGRDVDPAPPSRWQFELYGGAALLNPADFNRFVAYDDRVQEFFYDAYLTYMAGEGEISRWEAQRDGERRKIRYGWPFGLRIKYRFRGAFSASLGLKFLWGGRTSDINVSYTQTMPWSDLFTETNDVSPYTLSAGGWAPLAGFHYARPISDKLSLEISLAGGPLFARCRYLSEATYRLTIQENVNPLQGTNAPYVAFTYKGLLEEKGSGTGLAVEAGFRFDWRVRGRWGMFAEGGYASQKVKNLSGPGRELQGGESVEWDGRWAIRSEDVSTYWGAVRLEFPTNYWPAGSEDRRTGDFRLDLSGFQVRFGVAFRL